MVNMYVSNMRRAKDAQLKNMSITLQLDTIDKLAKIGVTSARGSGNLSAYSETAMLIVYWLFHSPEMAKQQLLDLIEIRSGMENQIRALAENFEDIAKRLYDSLE